MDKVFSVYLYNEQHYKRTAKLSLPATPYQLLDAVDKLRLAEGDSLHIDVDDYGGFDRLEGDIKGLNVFALNALAEKLTAVDDPHEIVGFNADILPSEALKPDYAILMEISHKGSQILLKLPADPQEMDKALDAIQAPDWSGVSIHCLDCKAPALIPYIGDGDNIAHINRLANRLAGMDGERLAKFKAVLDATEDFSVLGATHIANTLRDYLYEPKYTNPEDMARDFLKSSMGHASLSLVKYVDLESYGKRLLQEQHGAQTNYGMVCREDGQCLKTSLTKDYRQHIEQEIMGMEGMTM